MRRVEYDSNNSGGSWWLSDEDWRKLEKAGWKVDWREERWLGASATSATRIGLDFDEAIDEFFEVTGQDKYDGGCPCCGPPHSFTEYDDEDNMVNYGPDTDYSCSW